LTIALTRVVLTPGLAMVGLKTSPLSRRISRSISATKMIHPHCVAHSGLIARSFSGPLRVWKAKSQSSSMGPAAVEAWRKDMARRTSQTPDHQLLSCSLLGVGVLLLGPCDEKSQKSNQRCRTQKRRVIRSKKVRQQKRTSSFTTCRRDRLNG
jgi:hypothetical protein